MSEPESDIAGASARAEYDRRLVAHKEMVRRRRPMVLVAGAAFAIVGLLNIGSSPTLGWLFVVVALAVVVAGLFATPNTITAWATGAEGEARTARFLEPLKAEGFRVLHDRRIPGTRANIDHVVIGPPGIVVVETKSLKGRLTIRGSDVFVAGRRGTGMIEEARREALAVQIALADRIEANGYRVAAVVCVHRADLPLFRTPEIAGVRIVSGKGLVTLLRKARPVLSPAEVDELADLLAFRLKPAVVTPGSFAETSRP